MNEHRVGAGPVTVPAVSGVIVVDTLELPSEGVDETVISWGDDPEDCFSLDDDGLQALIVELLRRKRARHMRVVRQRGQIAKVARVVNHPLAG